MNAPLSASLSMERPLSAPGSILLAHHGTAGASRAEALAFSVAEPGCTRILHLFVVPDFWAGMQGDDWLNNASTRDVFGRYVEGILEEEASGQLRALEARCQKLGFGYTPLMRFGNPTQVLLETVDATSPDLVVIGSRRPRGAPGYRSHIDLDKLTRGLRVPLLIAPGT